ncbi:diguanylate cyclase [Pseudidiomarina salinarum]|uniref:Diguanylate cyclase n=1 Tax=Pseudidiomarina salinarum TaxID=435908 RepID=A0A094JDH7_9GAMM|nr:EAL domain-containing protein [Pseudidiomarina salinarum]KFZ30621.1 diguanylate cyclase [Pseudidiomarina salinarum]RUO69134.1 bifunctional diguanylate cyclase/phosphodiesterase [Pseudidiomarina salinarum]
MPTEVLSPVVTNLVVVGLIIAVIVAGASWFRSNRARKRLERLLEAKYKALGALVANKSLNDKLNEICGLIESQIPGSFCTIMRVGNDKDVLNAVAVKQFPQSFYDALQNFPISESSGACGPAVLSGQPVIVPDLKGDERFDGFRGLMKKHNLRAAWSFPVFAIQTGEVVGTFAVYFCSHRRPTKPESTLIERSRDLVSLVIEQNEERLRRERSEQHHRSLFTYNADPVFTLGLDGVFLSMNDAGGSLTGFDKADMVGQHYEMVVDEADRDCTRKHFEAATKGKAQSYEIRLTTKGGEKRTIQVTNTPIFIDGEVTGVHGIARDVTQQRETEKKLKVLERSVEASVNGVLICDANKPGFPVIYANPAFTEITGYSEEELMGKSCNLLQGEETDEETVEEIREALRNQREIRTVIRNYRKDGTPFWNELRIAPVSGDSNVITHFVGVQTDITERVNREEQLAFHAAHDVLTRLPNRTALEQRLDEALAECGDESDCQVYVLFIDLDGFKPINDSLGHRIGDDILVQTANRLRSALPKQELLARFGGDEFVAVLSHLDHRDQVLTLVEHLLNQFHEPYRIEDIEVSLSATVGIADSGLPFHHPMELIQRADVAMYEAKHRGGGAWQWFSHAMDEGMQLQVEMRAFIHDAINQQQFELFYQPIINQKEEIVAVEALIRWQHPQRGFISPAEFIPLAERSGQIIAISDWVLERACGDRARLKELGIPTISVNFSPIQFYRDDFIDKIKAAVENFAIKPGEIVIEITENVLVRDSEQIQWQLEQLQELGFSIAIDDFGTGFASLRYLGTLPVNILKIDRSFVQNIDHNQRNAAIARGVLAMTSELGIKAVAEGVETDAEHEYLRKHDCALMQGFKFCKPQPLDKLADWVKEQKKVARKEPLK